MRALSVLLSLTILSCASGPEKAQSPVSAPEGYKEIVKKYTVKSNNYVGLYQTFQADLTILNSDMANAALREQAVSRAQLPARTYWDHETCEAEIRDRRRAGTAPGGRRVRRRRKLSPAAVGVRSPRTD